MIVRRATLEDLDQLAVLFDEYRQFYGASSNLSLSAAFLKQRFENQESVIFIHIKDQKITGFVLLYLGFSSVACSTYYILDDVYVTPVLDDKVRPNSSLILQFYLHDMKMRYGLALKHKKVITNPTNCMKRWVLSKMMNSRLITAF